MTKPQRIFLQGQIFSLTLMASVQRADVYSPSAPEAVRNAFRKELRDSLEIMAVAYRALVVHLDNISLLSSRLSTAHRNALKNERLRVGTAQKALNLYLKYLWCLGEIVEPPHCPFDYQIIKKLNGCSQVRWTVLDSVEQYQALVVAARKVAGSLSLAKWELSTYNKAQPGSPPDAPKAACR